jgi:hypothetical protein
MGNLLLLLLRYYSRNFLFHPSLILVTPGPRKERVEGEEAGD